jgi:hypothetical protein
MLMAVSYVIVQVQMGILPVGHAATLLPTKPPSISKRVAGDPRRNLRANVEGRQ